MLSFDVSVIIARIAIPVVLPALGGLPVRMIVDLRVQDTLGQRLLQLVEKAVLVENLWRVSISRSNSLCSQTISYNDSATHLRNSNRLIVPI